GVHPHPAGDGRRVGRVAHLLAEAAVRLHGGGLLGRSDRPHELGRVEPPHVRARPRSDRRLGVRFDHDVDRRADRRADLQPRRVYTYAPELGVGALNLVSTTGAFLIALSILIFLVNLWRSRTHGQPAPNDPWGGATLEWSVSSPPPVYNFSVIPTVTSRLPRWRTERHGPMQDPPATPPEPIHVPGGSWWPMVAAFALPVLALAPLTQTLWIAFAGVALLITGVYGWAFEPFEV